MKRSRMALLLLAGTLVLAAAGCGGDDNESSGTTAEETTATTETGASSTGSSIQGTVGPGFDISVSGADSLSPGCYTLVVDDKSSAHNFHLTGPGGIDVATDVGAEGEESFELELVAGEYSFVCDPHSSQMHGTFTVG